MKIMIYAEKAYSMLTDKQKKQLRHALLVSIFVIFVWGTVIYRTVMARPLDLSTIALEVCVIIIWTFHTIHLYLILQKNRSSSRSERPQSDAAFYHSGEDQARPSMED